MVLDTMEIVNIVHSLTEKVSFKLKSNNLYCYYNNLSKTKTCPKLKEINQVLCLQKQGENDNFGYFLIPGLN